MQNFTRVLQWKAVPLFPHFSPFFFPFSRITPFLSSCIFSLCVSLISYSPFRSHPFIIFFLSHNYFFFPRLKTFLLFPSSQSSSISFFSHLFVFYLCFFPLSFSCNLPIPFLLYPLYFSFSSFLSFLFPHSSIFLSPYIHRPLLLASRYYLHHKPSLFMTTLLPYAPFFLSSPSRPSLARAVYPYQCLQLRALPYLLSLYPPLVFSDLCR